METDETLFTRHLNDRPRHDMDLSDMHKRESISDLSGRPELGLTICDLKPDGPSILSRFAEE